MDNLAHALVGAALGRAVADRRVPAAAAIGVIAGNAPDLFELVVRPAALELPHANLSYLVTHRGITHSLFGAAVETVVLAAVVGLLLGWHDRRTRAAPVAWGWVVACVAAAVVSHLYLDWQGSYGLRPFLPWSSRWYYADWVAIVDPFFWVVPLVALAWGARRHWVPASGYALALAALVALLGWAGRGRVVWWLPLAVAALTLLCALGWTRHWFGVAGRRRAAAYGLAVLALYAAASGAVSGVVSARVQGAALRRFGPSASSAALTVVGHPFTWEGMLASPDTVAAAGWAIPRHLRHPAVRRALATPQGQVIAGFARFLAAAVDSSGGRLRVSLWDARYHHGAGDANWAAVRVDLR